MQKHAQGDEMEQPTAELNQGQVILPDGHTLYWEKEEGYRTYYILGEPIFQAKHPSFVIAAAVAIEETLSYEEKRIYGSEGC